MLYVTKMQYQQLVENYQRRLKPTSPAKWVRVSSGNDPEYTNISFFFIDPREPDIGFAIYNHFDDTDYFYAGWLPVNVR